MDPTPKQKIFIRAYKTNVRPLLESAARGQSRASRVKKVSRKGNEYRVTTLMEKDSPGRYRLIIQLRRVPNDLPVPLTAADEEVFTAALDEAVVAAGWKVISGYPLDDPSAFGRRVALSPPSAE